MARCHASRTNGETCGNWAMQGQQVCHAHGGRAKQNKEAARRREVEAEAVGLLSKHGPLKPVEDPLHELLMLAGRAKRLLELLESRVNQLDTLRYENAAGGEQVRAELSTYMTMLDRCRAVLVDIVKLDIWERLARVEEKQVAMFAQALDAAMAEAGLTEKVSEVRGYVARHLRVAAG